jgi:hypothetical protein
MPGMRFMPAPRCAMLSINYIGCLTLVQPVLAIDPGWERRPRREPGCDAALATGIPAKLREYPCRIFPVSDCSSTPAAGTSKPLS